MDIDAALTAGAIAGGITGGIVAAVIALGVLRAQRHLGGTSLGAAKPTTEWRAPSGPLARHLAHGEATAAEAPERPMEE
ncbi:MAG TPA: hypothetical protein VGR46_14655 [Candidatus Limnocylindria bacterium]|jgi:hypothetical protein|nr:hypothetical protein [Candidatus Limnocylindria bacterium]